MVSKIKTKKSYTKDTFKIFGKAAIKYPFLLGAILVTDIGMIGTDTFKPLLYKRFFDALALGPGSVNVLVHVLLLVLLLNSAGWLIDRINLFSYNAFMPRVSTDLINRCYTYIQNHSYDFFTNNFSGSLVRRISRFSRSFEDIFEQFTWSTGQTVVRFCIILFIIYLHFWQLAAAIVVWACVYMFFQIWLAKIRKPTNEKRVELDTKTSAFLSDSISNHSTVMQLSGFNQEKRALAKLTDAVRAARKKNMDIAQVSESVQVALMVLLEFGLMYGAIQLWKVGKVTVGDFVLIQSYVMQLFNNLWNIGRNIQRLNDSIADASEMTEMLMLPHEVQDVVGAKNLRIKSGGIIFNNVGFSYQNKQSVFKNLSLEIKPKEKVALVGTSGGGKTTITKLLLRYYDIQKGSITIDGQNIAEVTQDSLRNSIGFVPQEPLLFHRSLLDNIKYAKPNSSKDEVIRAAKLAHAHEFISKFENGYDTFVGERGVKLSGGERQRVAIARAILKNAPILVLDEATSALDSESEKYIQDALKNLINDKTVIVIAHRLSTIMAMDRIIVVEKGKIKEQGSHSQLLKLREGTYQKLWSIQAGSFNL